MSSKSNPSQEKSKQSGKTIQSKTGVRKLYKEFKKKYADRPQICFLLQDWEDAYNVGSMFRLAEGLGATELIMTGRTPVPPDNPMIPVTSMGQHRRLPFRYIERHDEAAQQLKSEGWTLVAIEIAEDAEDYLDATYPEKCCLILGNEGGGVYGNLMKLVDQSVFIPMFGKGRSFNVTHAAAIVGYQALLGAQARRSEK